MEFPFCNDMGDMRKSGDIDGCLKFLFSMFPKKKDIIYVPCILLMTESRSARGASCHPAFMDGSLTVGQTHLPCAPCGKMRLHVLDCGDGNK